MPEIATKTSSIASQFKDPDLFREAAYIDGQWVTGTFTADTTSETLNLLSSNSNSSTGDGGSPQVNLLQLRDISGVPEPTALSLATCAALAFLLLVAWLERAYGERTSALDGVIARMAGYLEAIALGSGDVLHQGDHDDGKLLPLLATRFNPGTAETRNAPRKPIEIRNWISPNGCDSHQQQARKA